LTKVKAARRPRAACRRTGTPIRAESALNRFNPADEYLRRFFG
jgi:hypothetical protein